MTRPNKQGIDYFPLDVNFFSNEKILAISGEFAVKGEIITLRLLCEIYQNGYFVEYSELLKNKLARFGELSSGLIDEVVKKLVGYSFFDKAIFREHNVLTSKSIQQQYEEATKRRKNNDKTRFWLLTKEQKRVYAGGNRVNAYINPPTKGDDVYINPPTKGDDVYINGVNADIDTLTKDNAIEHRTEQGEGVITLCKYAPYNDQPNTDQHPAAPPAPCLKQAEKDNKKRKNQRKEQLRPYYKHLLNKSLSIRENIYDTKYIYNNNIYSNIIYNKDNNILNLNNTREGKKSTVSAREQFYHIWEIFKGKRNFFEKDFIAFEESTKELEVDFEQLEKQAHIYQGDKDIQIWINEELLRGEKIVPQKALSEKETKNSENLGDLNPLGIFYQETKENAKNTPQIEKKQGLWGDNISENSIIKEIVSQYHTICTKLPRIAKVTEPRKASIRARLKEYTPQQIIQVFHQANQSDFLTGINNRGWKANFDWIINPTNFIKILEKNYQRNEQTNNHNTSKDTLTPQDLQEFAEAIEQGIQRAGGINGN